MPANCPKCNSPLIANKAGRMYCKPCASKRGKSVRAKGNEGQRMAARVINACPDCIGKTNLLLDNHTIKWIREHHELFGPGIRKCKTCGGTGQDPGLDCVVSGISQRRKWDKGVPDLTVTLPCSECDGHPVANSMDHGRRVVLSCPTCNGTGKRTLRGEEKTLANLPKWLWGRGPKRPPAAWWWHTLEGVRCDCGSEIRDDYIYTCTCEHCKGTGWLSHPHDFLMIRRIADHEAKYDWLVLILDDNSPYPEGDVRLDTLLYNPRDDHAPVIGIYRADKWARAVT